MIRIDAMSHENDKEDSEHSKKFQDTSTVSDSCPIPRRLRVQSDDKDPSALQENTIPTTLTDSLTNLTIESNSNNSKSIRAVCVKNPSIHKITYFVGEITEHDPELAQRYGYHPFQQTSNLHHSSTFQYSIHIPSRALKRELDLVFSNADFENQTLYVIPTFQPSHYDLVAVSPETNWERNILLEYFMALVKRFVTAIQAKGYWADATDPASGYPVYSPRGTSLYPDVDGCWKLLKYPMVQAGCCKVLTHPSWNTKMYPATMFSTAPAEVIDHVLKSVLEAGPLSAVKELQNSRPLPKNTFSEKKRD